VGITRGVPSNDVYASRAGTVEVRRRAAMSLSSNLGSPCGKVIVAAASGSVVLMRILVLRLAHL
jgi:hypothetical protein